MDIFLLCETHGYSMCKVCMLIAYYQAFLKYSADVQGTLDKYPRIPGPVIQFLTAEHFIMNDYMLELVTRVADLIGYLEKAETNLADLVVQFLTLQVHFDNMEAKCYICNKFIDVAVGSVSKWLVQTVLLTSCLCHYNVSFSKISQSCHKQELQP